MKSAQPEHMLAQVAGGCVGDAVTPSHATHVTGYICTTVMVMPSSMSRERAGAASGVGWSWGRTSAELRIVMSDELCVGST